MEFNTKNLFYGKEIIINSFDESLIGLKNKMDSKMSSEVIQSNDCKTIKVKQNNQLIEESIDLRNGFRSDSFNRFGDDLFEVIVNYLPLKEKVIFTSVNKQFNRTLFKYQNNLIINSNNSKANQFNSLTQMIVTNGTQESQSDSDSDEETDQTNETNVNKALKRVNKIGFEWIVKKCEFIRKIDLRKCSLDKELIDLLCNNCKHLKEFYFTGNQFEEKDIIKLGQTFGNQLKKLVIDNLNSRPQKSIEKLLTYCQNLKSLKKRNSFSDCIQPSLPKLNSLSITLNDCNSDDLKMFANKFRQQLKVFKIVIQLNDGLMICNVLKEISSFANLEVLSLVIGRHPQINVKPIDSYLSRIAFNCPKLKSLEVCLLFCRIDIICGNLFDILSLFRNLKELRTCFPDNDSEDEMNSMPEPNNLTLKCFENCKDLRKLMINYSQLNDKLIRNIHKYIPNLREVFFNTRQQLSDKSMLSLSKLNKLKTLRFSKDEVVVDQTFYGLTDVGLNSLISSPSIKSIRFEGRPQITRKTVEFLIETALKNPKRNLIFICEYKHIHNCEPIHMKEFNHLPNNLKISISGDFDNDSEFDYSDSDSESFSSDEDSDQDIDLIIGLLLFL